MTQTERGRYLMQMRWLIQQSPEMARVYNDGYADAEQTIWISTPSLTVHRSQLKRAPSPRSVAYRLGWNDRLDNFAHGTYICAICSEVYSDAGGVHRCPPYFDAPRP